MPSLVSVQILFGIICFFYTTYLILSIFYLFPIQNIPGELRSQSGRTNINTTTNATKLISTNQQSTLVHKANLSTESFICDYVKKGNEHNQSNTSSSFEKHLSNALRREYSAFCLFLNNHIDLF
jgi:hypothetical protein